MLLKGGRVRAGGGRIESAAGMQSVCLGAESQKVVEDSWNQVKGSMYGTASARMAATGRRVGRRTEMESRVEERDFVRVCMCGEEEPRKGNARVTERTGTQSSDERRERGREGEKET